LRGDGERTGAGGGEKRAHSRSLTADSGRKGAGGAGMGMVLRSGLASEGFRDGERGEAGLESEFHKAFYRKRGYLVKEFLVW